MNKDKLIPEKCLYCNQTKNLVEIQLDNIGVPFYVCESCYDRKDQNVIANECLDLLDKIRTQKEFVYDLVVDMNNETIRLDYLNANMEQIVFIKKASMMVTIMLEIEKMISLYKSLTPNFKLSVTFRCYESSLDSKILNKIENYLWANVSNLEQWYDIKNSEQLVD